MKTPLCIVASFLILGEAAPAQTTVVAIWTPEAIVVGADSKGLRGGDPDRPVRVCKVVQADGFFFAMAGLFEEPDTGFSVDRIVRDASRRQASLVEKIRGFEALVAHPLARAIEHIKMKDPSRYRRDFEGKPSHLQIVFAGLENGLSMLHAREFLVVRAEHAEVTKRVDYPGDGPRVGFGAVYLGEHKGIDRFKAANPEWWKMGFVPAVRKFVQIEIDESPQKVGPPINILVIEATGARWVDNKHCPEVR